MLTRSINKLIDYAMGRTYIINYKKVDFADESTTVKEMGSIMEELQRGLKRKFPHEGKLIDIGSCYDGSKIERLNEVDAHFQMDEKDIVVLDYPEYSQIKVFKKGDELAVKDIHTKFLVALNDAVFEMRLPEGWAHSGFSTPHFSGVRCNGPAVTAMFRTSSSQAISLDITLAIPMSSDLQERSDHFEPLRNFPQGLKAKCQKLSQMIDHIQQKVSRNQLPRQLAPYLIADPVANTWKASTARAEAELLCSLPNTSVKNALDECKGIASKFDIIECTQMTRRRTVERVEGEFLNSILDFYSAKWDPESRFLLCTCMPYLHSFLTSVQRNRHHETPKDLISINTAAIKHIILRNAMTMEDAFSDSQWCKETLVRRVFEELADERFYYTEHAIFGSWDINKFSISVPAADIKQDLAYAVQKQCQFILENDIVPRKVD